MTTRKGKLIVVDEAEETRVPFLRGILTRSLQDTGVPFEDAYQLASDLRDRLAEVDEITTIELRETVAAFLEERGFPALVEHYATPRNERVSLYVRDRGDNVVPFSKSTLVQSLEVCAEPRELLYGVAAAVENWLLDEGMLEVDSPTLMRVTYEHLVAAAGERSSRRYLRWQEFTDTTRPLILLVGGVTGTGKSTIASLTAHRLGIIRTQSTDMLREVMRRMVPRRLIPSLHESSFNAHRVLPRWGREDGTTVEPHLQDGYLMQAGEVAVGIQGVFQRAVQEQVSMVMEGVHLHPALQNELSDRVDAVVVPSLLATIKRKSLRKQLAGRGASVSSRRAERYLDHLDDIWELQTFLLSEADQHDVPIITEREPDEMVRRLMRVIADRLEKEFEGDPERVFSGSAENPA